MEEVRITGLSRSNTSAIREVWPDGVMGTAPGDDITVTTTPTTATFTRASGGEIAVGNLLACLQHGMNRFPMRGHLRQSLHAVRTRIVAAFENQ